MVKHLLTMAGLALMAFGAMGLYQGSLATDAGAAALLPSLAIGAGLAIAVATLLLSPRTPSPPPEVPSEADRLEVIERLQRHSDALRAELEAQDAQAPANQDKDEPAVGPIAVAPNGRGAAAAHETLSLPAIMLLGVGPDAGIDQVETAPPLGTRAEVLERLREVLPDLELATDGRGQHTGPAHTLGIDAGATEPIHTVVLEAEGDAAVSVVRWLMEATGWRAFVPRRGIFVEAEQLERLVVRKQG